MKNPCSCSFMFGRTRTNTSVRSIRVRVRSSLPKTPDEFNGKLFIDRNDWVYELILTYLLNWIAYYISMKVNELRRWVNDIKTCLVLSLNNFYVPYCKYFGSQFLICVTGTLKSRISHRDGVLGIVWNRARWTGLIYPTVV